jgi:uncharacterized tellurite resistance protein B-like protein
MGTLQIKMAGASVNREFLQSISLEEWLIRGEYVFFQHETEEKRQAMLKTMWEIANPDQVEPKKKGKK